MRDASGGIVVCRMDGTDPAANSRRWAATFRDAAGPAPLFFIMNGAAGGAAAEGAVRAVAKEFGAPAVSTSAAAPETTERALVMFGETLLRAIFAPTRIGRRA